jgi:pimeloyl-ACP methyl ester carboxylesterase
VAKAEHYGIEHFTADLKKVIDVTNTKNPILVGHSMGGLISLAYQSRYHDAQKIILCATTAALIVPKRLPKWGEGFVDYVLQKTIENKSFMEKKLPDTFTSYAKKFYEEASPFFEGLQTVNLGTVLSCLNMMLKTDMLHNLDKITVPILVIEGKKDRLLPSLKEIDNLKNVSGEKIIITLEGTHFINREQPEKVAELIFNFLNDAK